MPPAARKAAEKAAEPEEPTLPEPEPEPEPEEPEAEGEICRLCWTDGWPGHDSAATCEHGTWTR